MLYRKSVFIIALFIAAVTCQAQEYDVEPGLWEMTYETTVKGMPEEMASMMQQGPEVRRECVTKENMNFKPQSMGGGCEYTTTSQSAGHVAWNIQCQTAQGTSGGQGEVNFNTTTTNGWLELELQGGPMGKMQMRNTFSGKRIGDC